MAEPDKGTYLQYIPRKFNQRSLDLIGQANNIIQEYEAQNLLLTLRQLYYQFVARGILPNVTESYNLLGRIVNDGRLAGLISWTAIEDRGRDLKGFRYYDSPSDAVKEVRADYKRDLWSDQPWRPEVWIEKAALEGVISSICGYLRVDFFATRGYNSQSEQWQAGQRLARYIRKGQRPIIFHLADHDPEGIDMTRDNRERLSMFTGVPIQVVRLALNMSQIEQYDPPPNFVKPLSPRAAGYRDQYGDECWELDALDPAVLRDLIRDAVLKIRDESKWSEALTEEAEDLRYLDDIINESGAGDGEDSIED